MQYLIQCILVWIFRNCLYKLGSCFQAKAHKNTAEIAAFSRDRLNFPGLQKTILQKFITVHYNFVLQQKYSAKRWAWVHSKNKTFQSHFYMSDTFIQKTRK